MQEIFGSNTINIRRFKEALTDYARKFDMAIILNSNSEHFSDRNFLYRKYDLIAGFIKNPKPEQLITRYDELYKINKSLKNWYLGYLTYDLKNSIEALHSGNPDYQKWPPVLFFRPSILILVRNQTIEIHSENQEPPPRNILNDLLSAENQYKETFDIKLKPRISKTEYLRHTGKILEHIKRGDIYELNYCQEFYDITKIDPYNVYTTINSNSPAPFSVFLKIHPHYLISASPERFLKKENSDIISQPMKGTSPRSTDTVQDQKLKIALQTDPKERAENIMITDLVRNDLSKVASKNSVVVNELCGVYPFPQVYQMISTISAQLKPINFAEIIKATFPMGSMTGAPKIKAMELIEKYETFKRGIYSGTVGYLAPGMDFDFNVVIRSLQYNTQTSYLSYIAGSALTALSDTEKEYAECLLKSYAINPLQYPVKYA